MKDRYGRKFFAKDILNRDEIGLIEAKPLSLFSDQEIQSELVVIESSGSLRLYLFHELQQLLQAKHYCRLEDPYTREDILDQLPEFSCVRDLERNAAHYNAYVLNNNPDFIPLLITYIKEVLNDQDQWAEKEVPESLITANTSADLVQFFSAIGHFSNQQKQDFFSLFVNNRSPIINTSFLHLPVKWHVNKLNVHELFLSKKVYRPYLHSNVLLYDLIDDPQVACMHSWGMDVLYLLIEYHWGTNRKLQVFSSDEDRGSLISMERILQARIAQTMVQGSLDPRQGQAAYLRVKRSCTDYKLFLLQQECIRYRDYLLVKDVSMVGEKYQAVQALCDCFEEEDPIQTDEQKLNQFVSLFSQKQRQQTIAQHRDSIGIRFLNIVLSILSFGLKNLVTYTQTNGYYGFWNSRGANFLQRVTSLLPPVATDTCSQLASP